MENWNMEHKVVTHIDCPKEWESKSDWDSHAPLLWVAINHNNKGNMVYEFGCGNGSTPLLSLQQRFNSFETNKEWADKFIHTVDIDSYFDIPFPSMFHYGWELGVLFIDCAPGEIRKDLIDKWKDEAKVILVHDTEIGAEYVYGMSDVLSKFKYRVDYEPVGKPRTTIISNEINVCEWIP